MNHLETPVRVAATLFAVCALASLSPRAFAEAKASGKPVWKFDFGTAALAEGYLEVDNELAYNPFRWYGWVGPGPNMLRDRQVPNALNRDYVFSHRDATFRVNVPPGLYLIAMTFCDPLYDDHFTKISLASGGEPIAPHDLPVVNPSKVAISTLSFTARVPKSPLDLHFTSPSQNWILNSLVIEPAETEQPFQIEEYRPGNMGQQMCLPETDPNSPRRTRLQSDTPDDEILHIDVTGDGKPDILERWWNGKRVRWFDENGDMKFTDRRGDIVGDSLQIDMDGDGYYDGPSDMSIKWADNSGDGRADMQIFAINPSTEQSSVQSGSSHFMVFLDIDEDNVHGYVDWETFHFACWRTSGGANFSPDYNGNSVFIKEHLPPFAIEDIRYSWENPFAFYDFDGDGCTEMSIRYIDHKIQNPDGTFRYSGVVDQVFVSYDLDNSAQRHTEMSFDMTLHFGGGERMDYKHHVNKFPAMKAPEWVLPFYRYTNWREIDELIFVPHEKCYEEMFKPEWGYAYFVFDEDDDDHRWERVELYYPDDPYNLSRWGEGKGRGLIGHPQSDSLGDRAEFDTDFSGGGKLYVGAWDKKLHLFGAEWGAWLVDYGARYWGSNPVVGRSSPRRAKRVGEVVHYRDTNGNGYIDEISFDYDGDKKRNLTISLLDFATPDNPHPDVQPLHDPAELEWHGLHELFKQIVEEAWQDAHVLYRAAWKAGLTDPIKDDLAISASTMERYEHAYWLKEKILRDLLDQSTDDDEAKTLLRHYYTGDIEGLARYVESRAWPGKKRFYEAEYIQSKMKAAFRYILAHPFGHPNTGWERAALYTGIVAAYDATGDEEYLQDALRWATDNETCPRSEDWEFTNTRHGYWFADNQACGSTYLRLYQLQGGGEKIAHTKKIMDDMVATPPPGRKEWWWCDALFMAPPVMARLSNVTGDPAYLDLMDEMWWDCTDFLYDPEEHLYFRDKNFFDRRAANGRKVFWSRGNGWVMGGYARVLAEMPEDYPSRDRYIQVFREMAAKLVSLQGADGYWRMSLLDPEQFDNAETSGTGFFTFALAWGVNNGILERELYEPAVRRGWEALLRAVSPGGKLCWVQAVAASPYDISFADTQEYGVGAFLLAASEILQLDR